MATRPKNSESGHPAPDSLCDETVRVVGVIREAYLTLGELINKVSDTRAYKSLGFKSLKDFIEEKCDVINGPSASVARRINRFLADDAKAALQGRPEDYERLAAACRQVSTEKLKELERNSDLVSEETVEEIIGNLENLPTKKFKSELKALRARADGRDGHATGSGSRKGAQTRDAVSGDPLELSADAPDSAGAEADETRTVPETQFEVRVVKKTFKLPKHAEPTVDAALRKALAALPPGESLDAALVEICKTYVSNRATDAGVEDPSAASGAVTQPANAESDVF